MGPLAGWPVHWGTPGTAGDTRMGIAGGVPSYPIRRGDRWGQVRQACDLRLGFVTCPLLSPVCPRLRDWQGLTAARCPRIPHCPHLDDAVFTEMFRPRPTGPAAKSRISPRSYGDASLPSLLLAPGCCSSPVRTLNCSVKILVLPSVRCPCFPFFAAGVLMSGKCFCPSRTPKRCGNYKGPGTPRPFCAEDIHWPPRHAALAPMAIAAAIRFIGLSPCPRARVAPYGASVNGARQTRALQIALHGLKN